MAQDTIQIKHGQHVFITGMTGSGKSQLARFLLGSGGFPKVIVQDGKHEFEAPYEWGEEGKGFAITDDLYEVDSLFKKFHKVIWRPDVEDLEDPSNWHRLDELYDFVYQMGDMVLYDDEASMSCTTFKYPTVKKRLLKQGRSKGISVWNVTQAPVGIPNDFMREASHAFIFYLNAESDREKVSKNYGKRIMKMNDLDEQFLDYMFYYYSVKNRGVLKKYNPIPI